METLGARIKYYRSLKGLTQDEISFTLGISRLAFSNIERNITDISFSRLNQIAEALGADIHDLIPSKKVNPETINKEDEIIILQKKLIELMERLDQKRPRRNK